MDTLAYLPGEEPRPGPLARFLPPIPTGLSDAFRSAHLPAGDGLLLDPFGASPRLMVEAARAGLRLVTAVNNPVTRFLLEMSAAPPPRAEFQAALAALAAARKGEERLETHLQDLYLTECVRCRRSIPAEAFLWERGGETPIRRLYRCPCGESGEFAVTEADRQRALNAASASRLHRARALERVAALDDPDRPHVAEALNVYLPRSIYALLTVVNKLDGLALSPLRRRCLTALLLTACDQTNALWPFPTERPRPRQLTIPPRFFEYNLWRALEAGVDLWTEPAPPVPLTLWPELPPAGGGICLFEGPVRDLSPHLKGHEICAVLTALPRPNQAFWTLSALWAGWLWGREAVTPFKMVLRRRRYDWAWHAEALHAALKNLPPLLPLSAPFFGIIAEPEPPYLSAAILAAAAAGLDLGGIALRTPDDPVYLLWRRRAFAHKPLSGVAPDRTSEARPSEPGAEPQASLPDLARQAIHAYLSRRGEPATYLHVHAAALASLAEEGVLPWGEAALATVQSAIFSALQASAFIHHGGSDNPETGLWGLPDLENDDPLPDRLERLLVHFLNRHPGANRTAIEAAAYAELPGLLTPPLALILAVLESYAVEVEGRYQLRPEDAPAARLSDLEQAGQMLSQLGLRLGYLPRWQNTEMRLLTWEEKGRPAYAFYLLASAAACRLVRGNPYPPKNSLLVLPGGRVGLLSRKLARDPVLARLWAGGWRVLKYRQLRRLAALPNLDRKQWAALLDSDPLEPPEQMKLF
ncbi:MAG: hypothetical protein ABWK53_12605 [Anaerolineales bacterium]